MLAFTRIHHPALPTDAQIWKTAFLPHPHVVVQTMCHRIEDSHRHQNPRLHFLKIMEETMEDLDGRYMRLNESELHDVYYLWLLQRVCPLMFHPPLPETAYHTTLSYTITRVSTRKKVRRAPYWFRNHCLLITRRNFHPVQFIIQREIGLVRQVTVDINTSEYREWCFSKLRYSENRPIRWLSHQKKYLKTCSTSIY